MQRVIGLDIGSYSIKAVEIVNTFNSYEIINFYENVIPQIDKVDADVIIPACMEQLFQENNLQVDRIVTAMPGQYISSRIMSFQFHDLRRVGMAIMAEIEDYVPFDMDDMIVDYQILGMRNGKTDALVVLTKKNFLRNFLNYLQKIHIDPKLIDIDSLALYNLVPYLPEVEDKCCAVVDIGHEKTSICVINKGVLRLFRSINLGGRYISEFLARDVEVSFNEAQRLKHKVSRVFSEEEDLLAMEMEPEDLKIAEKMTFSFNAIVKELGRTFFAFKNLDKTPISEIFISGGTSKIQGIDCYLEEQLDVKVAFNSLNESDLKISQKLNSFRKIMPQSVAIGMRAVASLRRHSQINLRKGEFAYVQDYESIFRYASFIAKIASIVVLLLGVSYSVQYYVYSTKIDDIQNIFKKEYYKILTKSEKKQSRKQKFSVLQRKAQRRLKKDIVEKNRATRGFLKKINASSPLVGLMEVSKLIPKKIKVDLTFFHFTHQNNMILKGETDGYASVEAIIHNLKMSSNLHDVKEKSSRTKPGTDNKIIEFVITAHFK